MTTNDLRAFATEQIADILGPEHAEAAPFLAGAAVQLVELGMPEDPERALAAFEALARHRNLQFFRAVEHMGMRPDLTRTLMRAVRLREYLRGEITLEEATGPLRAAVAAA